MRRKIKNKKELNEYIEEFSSRFLSGEFIAKITGTPPSYVHRIRKEWREENEISEVPCRRHSSGCFCELKRIRVIHT